MFASQTGKGANPSSNEQSRSKGKISQHSTKDIDLLSSDSESHENPTSYSAPLGISDESRKEESVPAAGPNSAAAKKILDSFLASAAIRNTANNADTHPAFVADTSGGNVPAVGQNSASAKKVLDKFLKESAKSHSENAAVELNNKMMESDEDSSSSESCEVWEVSPGTNRDLSTDLENNGRNNECGISSDSSVEVIHSSRPQSQLRFSPVGRRMNGRHLSGRQRRLELARSRNNAIELYGDDSEDGGSNNDNGDNSLNCFNLASGNKGEININSSDDDILSDNEVNRTSSISRIHDPTETYGTNDGDQKSNAEMQVLNSKPNNISTTGLPRENSRYRKQDFSQNTTKKTMVRSGAFDNLYCNGKDFFAWAGINNPKDFLSHSKDYVNKVNVWRKERNMPLFGDAEGYIEKLRRQVRNNIKAIETGGEKALDVTNRSQKRRKDKRKDIYYLLKDLPMEGGNFMEYMKINKIEDVFKHNGLHKHVNEWRRKQELPLVDDERACITNWQKWIRQNVKHQASGTTVCTDTNEDPPDEIDFSNCMKVVSSLSKRFLNSETGLPVYQFAVYDNLSSDIIYEFRVEAKTSLIPNAGNGAFLTFLGAREAPCKWEEYDEALRVETIQPLISKDSEGHHMSIKVLGEHLNEGGKRSQYPPPTSLPSIHGSPEERAIGTSKYPWTLEAEEERFSSRYVENSEIPFSTNQIGCSVIEIGRYGPFRRSDRKYQLHYDLKNFIFSNEVSEWGFDVIENLNGHEQVADVTDDSTGMPHDVTKQNIAMYVNETGGDPGLEQTVWSGQVLDREVNYYFQTEKPMKKGETIELLISYFGTYDEIRERKGYGERNKSGNVLSDNHFPSFLERNFVERYDMVEVIYEVYSAMDLYLLSEFLEKIRCSLARIIDEFIQQLQSSSEGVHVPYAQQIIALRRLNWLKPFFLKKIESLRKKVSSSADTNSPVTAFYTSMLQQCAVNAKCLDWASWPILMDMLEKHPNLTDGRGINVRTKFREEVTEDICYGISSSLLCPCNESIWCGVACTLTHDLCYIIARDQWDNSKINQQTNLTESVIQKAVQASEAITDPKSFSILSFDTNVWKRYALSNRGGISKEPRGTKCVMILPDDCQGPPRRLPAPFILPGNSADQTHILKSIHKSWYLVRQILVVVDAFAKKYLVDDKSYSFEILREKLGVTLESTSLFLKEKVKLDLESCLFYGRDFESIYSRGNNINPCKQRSSRKRSMTSALKTKTKKPRTLSTPVKKLLFWDVLIKRLQELGWNIERGNRPGDWYLLPPGVVRGRGFKPRVDFFDSAPLVINCLKTDTRYCNLPEIKSIMAEYRECQVRYEEMKASKSIKLKTLSNIEIVEYLRGDAGASTTTGIELDTTKATNQNNGIIAVKVVFRTEQLGILLHVADGQVFIKGVKNQDVETQINAGDAIIAVGDRSTRNKSLAEVCELVRESTRPLTITFERKVMLAQNTSPEAHKPSA